QELPTRHTIDVENIMQTPELPYGCEIVSLTIVLQYLGFNVDKMDMADNYLETIYFWRADDELYGADPYEAFPGDPRDKVVTGCFAPVIVRSAEKFFFDRKSNCYPVNTSETPLDDLLHTYIDNDKPVIIWVTSSNLHEIEYKNSWKTADGRTINFPSYQHCLVLTGYDTDVGVVYVADPLKGNIAYDKWLFNVRYEELGMQSLVIEEGLE
ncbi:MAG: C39 family peptidase, partial [Ruminococcus sp.]|nr:C39 family peptidase [Ruminococcus sp.]